MCMKNDIGRIIQRGLDQRLQALKAAHSAAQRPARGWLRAVRDAVDLSQDQVATKLGIRRQSYAQMEAAEARGAISLNSLQRGAEALGCELVYFMVPRENTARTYDELRRAHDPLFKHLQASEHSMALEGQPVGDLKPPSGHSG